MGWLLSPHILTIIDGHVSLLDREGSAVFTLPADSISLAVTGWLPRLTLSAGNEQWVFKSATRPPSVKSPIALRLKAAWRAIQERHPGQPHPPSGLVGLYGPVSGSKESRSAHLSGISVGGVTGAAAAFATTGGAMFGAGVAASGSSAISGLRYARGVEPLVFGAFAEVAHRSRVQPA